MSETKRLDEAAERPEGRWNKSFPDAKISRIPFVQRYGENARLCLKGTLPDGTAVTIPLNKVGQNWVAEYLGHEGDEADLFLHVTEEGGDGTSHPSSSPVAKLVVVAPAAAEEKTATPTAQQSTPAPKPVTPPPAPLPPEPEVPVGEPEVTRAAPTGIPGFDDDEDDLGSDTGTDDDDDDADENVPDENLLPAPPELVSKIDAEVKKVLGGVRSKKIDLNDAVVGLEARIDAIYADLRTEYNVKANHFAEAIQASIIGALLADEKTPKLIKDVLSDTAHPVEGIADLKARLLKAGMDYRKLVIIKLRDNADARKIFGIEKALPKNPNTAFNAVLQQLFDERCSAYDFGALALNLDTLVDPIVQIESRSTKLANKRERAAQKIAERLTPKERSDLAKSFVKTANIGLNLAGAGGVAYGIAGLTGVVGTGGIGAILGGLGILAAKGLGRLATGVGMADVGIAFAEDRKWELIKTMWNNNVIRRRFKADTTMKEDLKDAGMKTLRSFKETPAGTMESKLNLTDAKKHLSRACEEALK